MTLNLTPPTSTTRTITITTSPREQIDEYGFIIMSEGERYDWRKFLAKMRRSKGGSTVGACNKCKSLCRYLPHKVKMPNRFQMISGTYWCKECEIIMRSLRCQCCGNLGRSKARHRKRDDEKRID